LHGFPGHPKPQRHLQIVHPEVSQDLDVLFGHQETPCEFAGKDIVCFSTALFGPVEKVGSFVLIGRRRDMNVVTELKRTGESSAEEAMPPVQSDLRVVTRLKE
jgi:hypothetical protein